MLRIGVYVQQLPTGKWHVYESAQSCPPGGRQSQTGYDTQELALKAAKEENFD
ncbi:hypothetical protein MKY41_11350 [Sporosarcina sp. FSL W7-1349]|uniref:hypothetical protein n=1 Tax=Sporosarcina sp. FSL W7-1349 TaxID=2921561 RepID=UPI0030FA8587